MPGWSNKPLSIPESTVWSPDVGINIAKIKGWVIDHWGYCAYQVQAEGNHLFIVFTVPTMSKWVNGWLLLIVKDEKRRNIYKLWDPVAETELGMLGIRRRMRSRWRDCTIHIFAEPDDTLPNEGVMSEEELMLFDGKL